MVRSSLVENLTYHFNPITYEDVLEIEKWRYNGFEECLYMDSYHESFRNNDNPLKGPRNSIGYSAFSAEGKLFGIMEFYFEEDGVHLGLAVNPLYVGRGLSGTFILDGINFLKSNYNNVHNVLLEVDRRNIQAIKAYEKIGFKFYQREGNELKYRFLG